MNDRIVSTPQILGGKPCVKGTRIPVYMVLELVEAGISFHEIRAKYYPQLLEDDIRACIVNSASADKRMWHVKLQKFQHNSNESVPNRKNSPAEIY